MTGSAAIVPIMTMRYAVLMEKAVHSTPIPVAVAAAVAASIPFVIVGKSATAHA